MSKPKKIKTDPDYISTEEFINIVAPFACHDLTLKVGKLQFYVNKKQLMDASPVFKQMLSADFKEKNAKEITLKGKDPRAFGLFLRFTLLGEDELKETDAHLILPIAHEYQTEKTLTRIDASLAEYSTEMADSLTSEQAIDSIIEAEFFGLSEYLETCIKIASHKTFNALPRNENFNKISKDTRYTISMKRWENLENKYRENPYGIHGLFMNQN
ncbi:unnamed protein product [Mytilus coruscus]|uniref:BTB domain-containing protein n=1 Tax=Mytilus coruscus TaxID=42192 RepID=A0A6J8A6S5_MYTCO|nr:unnamed protein product [Mytilus coruscus]